MQLLGGYKGETLIQIKAHLMSEYADGSCSRAVFLSYSFGTYAAEQVQILFHRFRIDF